MRRELIRERELALERHAAAHPRARKERGEMDVAYRTYLAEDPVLPAASEETMEIVE